MAKQTINVGAAPNDGTGDTLRAAMVKVNANTTELYDADTALSTALAGKAATSHSHATGDVTGLDTALAGKAATAHTHGVADLTATGTKDATTYLRGDNTWATPAGGGGGPTALDDLTDVALSSPAPGDVLTYDGTTWENAPPGGSGGPPSGAAGGVLSGTYPNPGFAADMATQAELNAVESASIAADAALDTRLDLLEAPLTVTTQSGTTYTYVLADADTLVRHNNAAAITATIPPNSSVAFPIGTTIAIVQAGAGAVTLTPGVGVTLKVAATHTLVTGGTDALVHLVQTAANVWTVAGNLVETGGGGGGGGAPTDAEYVVATAHASLSAERVLTAGTNVTLDTATPGQIKVNAAAGSVPHIRIETRTMPTTVGNYVEVGQYVFTGARKAALFDVAVQVGPSTGQGVVKHYLIAVSSQYLPSGFVTVRPDTSANYNARDAHLEMSWNDTTVVFRLRQGYIQASTATVNIRQLGDEAAVAYTPLSGTGTSAASGEYLIRPSRYESAYMVLGNTVGNFTNIGSWAGWVKGMSLRVTVTPAANSSIANATQYLVVASTATPTGYREITPVARALAGTGRDCILEANVSATPTLDLRLAQAAGSFGGWYHVLMEVLTNWDPVSMDGSSIAANIPTFTASSLTGTSTASTATPWDNGERVAVRSVTATYTAGTGDRVIIADATAGAFTVNLPLADFYTKGLVLYVRNKGTANSVTLDGNGSQTIDGATTKAITFGTGVVVICDGAAWHTFVG